MNAQTLPTKRDEAWRYSDLDAVSRVWADLEPAETLHVPENGHERLRIDELPASGILRYDVTIADGARFDLHCVLAGRDYGRVEIAAKLGKGAHFELGGAMLAKGTQVLEIVTDVEHVEPEGTSNQTVRSVLADKATGSFLGKIGVARDAQRTDAEQSVKSMLLDRGATANAVPQLEIFADDVKCAHGATVGELDKQALFYMSTRGLPPETARRLMLQAFISDAFVSIDDDEAREALEAKAQAALENLR
ncbi:SufD family Fe-S cluster assembly protein [Novosphingopyxis iocasae]|uniref:SufD family Fe-S cluster assembly protein n=1 Tax=Novosphingopyxis iocasae TaxID=2762729 RepID=UPI0016513BF2|nr:SufD family Fe-S cluster assembly protein [Novosphingopyxis iocasae]